MLLLPPAVPGLPHWQSSNVPQNLGQSLAPAAGKGASLLKVQSTSGTDEFHEGPQYQVYTCVAFWVLLVALRPSSMVA